MPSADNLRDYTEWLIANADRRYTWLAWKALAYLKEQGGSGVPPHVFREYMLALEPNGAGSTVLTMLIRMLKRLGVIGTRGGERASLYYLTVYGGGLLDEMEKRNPAEPLSAPFKEDVTT